MTDLLFMDVKCLVSTDLSHYFMPFTHAQCCPSVHEFARTVFLSTWFTALTLFYDVKRRKVVKVSYEINSVITA